ncbi:MAG: histidine phosphatase family protein [Motiliproteus sp.]|nr:histidine phosphatase family protein [Motiliproteus sp.]MCW9051114.1 histidine phosphatase family protein [Motiliproteus sp.]
MPHKVYFLRHGEAGYASNDAERTLTENGRQQTVDSLHKVRERIKGLDGIFASPYRRAQESAQIAKQQLELDCKIVECSQLVPEASPQQLLEWLQSQQQDLLLVGHNPLFTRTLNLFIGADPRQQHMDTSSIAAVEYEISAAGCGELLWLSHRV